MTQPNRLYEDKDRFEEIRKDLDNVNDLPMLFKLWKEAHKSETKESFEKTAPFDIKQYDNQDNINRFKENFIYDGVTSKNGNADHDQKTEVLFILKESNSSEDIKNCFLSSSDTKDNFWFNETPNDKTRKKYMGVFNDYLGLLPSSCDTRTFGYMNINKRGGLGSNDKACFKEYLKTYLPFILKQIEIMDPNYIFICGFFDMLKEVLLSCHPEIGKENWSRCMDRHIQINKKAIRIMHMVHPSSWRKDSINKNKNDLERIIQLP
ncbi:MAG: hypothetical protein IJL46_03120 [Clostridia bacterium]|nr:hypothetical protein [Clostridia bacterium]